VTDIRDYASGQELTGLASYVPIDFGHQLRPIPNGLRKVPAVDEVEGVLSCRICKPGSTILLGCRYLQICPLLFRIIHLKFTVRRNPAWLNWTGRSITVSNVVGLYSILREGEAYRVRTVEGVCRGLYLRSVPMTSALGYLSAISREKSNCYPIVIRRADLLHWWGLVTDGPNSSPSTDIQDALRIFHWSYMELATYNPKHDFVVHV